MFTTFFRLSFYCLFFLTLALSVNAGIHNLSEIAKGNGKQSMDVDSFPVPKDIDNLLFYIQRDPNTNTICYTLNIDKGGKLNVSTPIHAFWIRYPEGAVIKDLNFIQRKFAYGINTKKLADGSYDVRSVAYNKLPMKLKKDEKGVFKVYADINKKESVLERIFIRIGDGGTFWNPDVKYIELKGVEVKTGKKVLERFKP